MARHHFGRGGRASYLLTHAPNETAGAAPFRHIRHYPFAGKALFESVEKMDLEGIVAKRMDSPYGAGTTWYKIKNPNYSQAIGRHELFERFHNRG